MKFSINDFFIFCPFFISSYFISLKIYGCLFELYLDCILCFANVSDQFISRPIAEIVKKVSVSGVFLVHIFQCSDWIRRFTEYPIQMQKNVNPKNFKCRHIVRSGVVLVTAADSSHPKKVIVQSKSFFQVKSFNIISLNFISQFLWDFSAKPNIMMYNIDRIYWLEYFSAQHWYQF